MEKCDEHSGVCKAIVDLEKSDENQWKAINEIKKRPPVWCTCVISLLTFLVGCSVTYSILFSKFIEMNK